MKKVLAMFLSVCFIATAFLCVPATAASPASDIIGIRPKTYLWTKDITSLKATVIYDNQLEDASLLVTCAQYDKDGKLLSATPQTFPVSKGENKTLDVSVPVNKKATDAKFFAWASDDTYAPATSQAELSKVTSGELVYVDVNYTGSSQNGSFKFPYQTVEAALSKKVKTYLNYSNPPETIYVILKSGEYIDADYEPLTLTSDYYSDDTEVIFTSLEGEKAAFSGALRVEGFEDANDDGIYEAQVSKVNGAYPLSRQLFVNGIKATRARSGEDVIQFTNLDANQAEFQSLGLTSSDPSFASYSAKSKKDLELHFIEKWMHYILRAESITYNSSSQTTSFKFNNVKIDKEVPLWETMMTNDLAIASVPVYIENALELLDEEGEWYYNDETGKLYYMPRSFEDMATAEVILPVAEQLIVMHGESYKSHAKNISFKNLDFKYTTWNFPTTHKGLILGQCAGISKKTAADRAVMIDGGKGMGMTMPGAVTLYDITNVHVEGCDFSQIGSQALKMTGAVQNCSVIGNEFYDISGTGMTLGDIAKAKNDGRSQPYDFGIDADCMVIDNEIANNYIHKVATDYYSAAGIGVGFPINTTIRNNEIADVTSCGLHIGTYMEGDGRSSCTQQFNIIDNYIHNVYNWRLLDGAAIYAIGPTGGNKQSYSKINGNYLKDIKNLYGGIYPDEYSNFYEITENVINLSKYTSGNSRNFKTDRNYWLHIWIKTIDNIVAKDNYSTTMQSRQDGDRSCEIERINVYSPSNVPEKAQQIIDKAGIEPEYQALFDFGMQSLAAPNRVDLYSYSKETTTYIDVISSKDRPVDIENLEISVKQTNPDAADVTAEKENGQIKCKITYKKPGNTWITLVATLKDKEGNVIFHDEFSFVAILSQ